MGKEMVTTYAITTVIVRFSTVFIMGMSSSSGVIIGNTIERREINKAQEQGVTFLLISAIIGLFGCVIIRIIILF